MTCIAQVTGVDPMREGIRVVVGYRGNESVPARVVTELSTEGGTWQTVDPREIAPTIYLPDDVARALLDGLAAHYGGTGDTRALRRDYDAERARVDRLLDRLLVNRLTD